MLMNKTFLKKQNKKIIILLDESNYYLYHEGKINVTKYEVI